MISIPVTVNTRRDTNDEVVYDLIPAVLGNQTILFRKNPVLGYLSQDFDALKLNLRLDEGTLQYLNRGQPTFCERCAWVLMLLPALSSPLPVGSGRSVR